MKYKINQLLLLSIFSLLMFWSCQDEEADIDTPNEQETIQPSSPLANLMSMTSANFGGMDDFLDGSSCFSLELPITILVSNTTIIIESEEDLEQLEDLFDDYEDDDDFLDFVFPITIIFSDYSEIVIENEDQLENFIDDCDDIDDTIECVDFVYPVSFSVFNAEFDLLETVTVENDEALYEFLDNLEDDINALIVSLNYPVSLVYANGDTVEVNSNQELADAISAAGDDCDDDYLDCNYDDVAELLLECSWDIDDENEDFENNQMIFYEDGTVQITEGDAAVYIGGNWELTSTDYGLILNITELTAYQDDLGGEWLIVDCDDDELEIVRGDYSLELDQNCDTEPECSQSDVSEYLMSCYIVPTVNDNTSPMTYFQFSENNSLFTMYQGDLPHSGTWDISSDDNGVFIFINFPPFIDQYYNGQWYLQECNDDGLVFHQGDDVLVLACDPNSTGIFDCFENREVVVCDEDNDGFVNFDLNEIYDCPEDNVVWTFHLTLMDAETNTNALVSPFTNYSNPQIVYVRVESAAAPDMFEIFTVELIIEDCSTSCSEEDVDAFLTTCIWNAVNYNGSDNLMNYNFDFEPNSQIVVIYNDETTIDATWTTSQSDNGVIVTFSNVAGPNIQAITGEWLVVECESDRLEMHQGDNILVLEQDCD